MDVFSKLIPSGGLGYSETGELIDAIVQPAAQCVIAELDSVNRDDRKLRRQAAILRKVEQGWHEFPPGQVTGSAKNDEHRRFELVIRLQIGCFALHWSVFIIVATGFVGLPRELLLRRSTVSLVLYSPLAGEPQIQSRCKRSRLIRRPAGEGSSFPAAQEDFL